MHPRPIVVIEPRQPGLARRAGETWRRRRLIGYFGRSALEKTYRRTVLGWLWIPLRPVLSIGSRVLIFGGLLGAPSGGKPYLLFFLVGMTAWTLFAGTATWTTRSLDLGKRVLRRVYVPRLTVLIGSCVPAVVNFLLYVAMLGVAVSYYLVKDGRFLLELGWATLLVPTGLLLTFLLGSSLGLWLSVFAAQARDVRFGLGYALGFWLFVTPVIYPLSAVPSGYRTIAAVNPLTAPLEMVRHGLLGSGDTPPLALAISIGWVLVVGGFGLRFFNRSEELALDGT